jgi:hypothetical protein
MRRDEYGQAAQVPGEFPRYRFPHQLVLTTVSGSQEKNFSWTPLKNPTVVESEAEG